MKNWNINTFIKLTIVVLLLCYAWWFLTAPFQFSGGSTEWLIIGLVLLAIYIIISTALLNIKHSGLKTILFLLNLGLLCINALYLLSLAPRLDVSAICNGNTYFVTSGSSFFDPRLDYIQWTKWNSTFDSETHVLSYDVLSHPDEIVCDVESREAHFIKHSKGYGLLLYIDGSNPQDFEPYATAQLGSNRYFLAEDWIEPKTCDPKQYWGCDFYVHTLYECDLDYLNCSVLPITYTHHREELFVLQADENSEEVRLVEATVNSGAEDEMLIFTYGKNPRCYVTGCKIGSAQ